MVAALEGLRREIAATNELLGYIQVESESSPGHVYLMVKTPEGIAVHHGEGCEGEQFGGVTSCHHSKENTDGMTTALVQAEAVLTPTPIDFNAEQMKVIKNTICKGASDAELDLFVSTCKRTGLDPFMKQIYAVKRYDSQTKGQVMAIQVGIDGQRLIAERTGLYDGQDPIEWLDTNGQWSEVWTGVGKNPVAARCSVYRKDWTPGRKATAVVRWESYAQTYGADHKLMPTWAAMPDVMLGKCAESLALRRAFPAEMSAVAALTAQPYDPTWEVSEAVEEAHVEPENVIDGQSREVEGAVASSASPASAGEPPEASEAPPATPPDTACVHDWKYDELTTLNACVHCGVVDAEPPAR